jgi:hypothetical protein
MGRVILMGRYRSTPLYLGQVFHNDLPDQVMHFAINHLLCIDAILNEQPAGWSLVKYPSA